MATCSFDKPLVVRDKKTLDVIVKGLEKSPVSRPKIDANSELQKGRAVLAKSMSRWTTYGKK